MLTREQAVLAKDTGIKVFDASGMGLEVIRVHESSDSVIAVDCFGTRDPYHFNELTREG